ncbi:MAG TPA: NAD(P)/FAD-dependent oxidoreductase [Acidobacteriota bacterium]|nr:NAD(P)/FAD-dependent oxidoreductase [Acidobacteriota bacterium]
MAGRDSYDVIVLGGGIGGLTAAGLLAKAGRRVLVLERESRAGGHAAGYDWRGRPFDPNLHMIMGGGPSDGAGRGVVTGVLSRLGAADGCQFVRNDPFYRVLLPGFDLTVSGAGRRAFVDSYRRHFPAQADSIEELMAVCSRINLDTLRFPIQPTFWQRALAPLRHRELVRSLPRTLLEALHGRGIRDEALSALTVLWLYLGLPPSRASFLLWAVMMGGMVDEGAFYSLGGFRRMAQAFQQGVKNQGAEVRTGAAATRILVDGDGVEGVETTDGETFRAPVVISNIDARATMQELLGPRHLPRSYRELISGLETSVYLVSLYTAVPRELVPPQAVHENLVFANWDHEGTWKEGLEGRISGVTVTIPSISDDSLVNADEHLVVLKWMIPPNPASVPAEAAATLAARASAVIPGLPEYLGMRPDQPQGDPQLYSMRTVGPIYGWAQSPQQSGPYRPSNITPVRGLYLCGHWSQPGAGIRTVVTSGMAVSRLVLDERTSQGLIA